MRRANYCRDVRHPSMFCAFLVAMLFVPLISWAQAKDVDQKGLANSELALAPLPEFAAFNDVKQKKQAFFDYFLPMVENENDRLLKMRARLLILENSYLESGILEIEEQQRLSDIASEFELDTEELETAEILVELKQRVDVVPPSLALSQAAKESGWGTSRFAQQANNYFGQWCFSRGCGLVPRLRSEGSSHEVRKFESAYGSVRAYMKNLNTYYRYEKLRGIRADLRGRNLVSGLELAEGLDGYSERGYVYVEEIRSLISYNKLNLLDASLQARME